MSVNMREDLGEYEHSSQVQGAWEVEEWVASTREVHIGQSQFHKWERWVGTGSPWSRDSGTVDWGGEVNSETKLGSVRKWVEDQPENKTVSCCLAWWKGELLRWDAWLEATRPQSNVLTVVHEWMIQGLRQGLPGLGEIVRAAGGLQADLKCFPLISQYSKGVFLAHPKLIFYPK